MNVSFHHYIGHTDDPFSARIVTQNPADDQPPPSRAKIRIVVYKLGSTRALLEEEIKCNKDFFEHVSTLRSASATKRLRDVNDLVDERTKQYQAASEQKAADAATN